MSIYGRTYIARIAPCSEDWREAIRLGVDVIHEGRLMRESFAAQAFIATQEPAPVWLSHDQDRGPVGHVINRITHGGWHIAEFKLDHSRTFSAVALDLLRVGAPVSLGATMIAHDELLAKDGTLRHTVARLDEISILAPNEKPMIRGAQVTQILEPPSSSPAAQPYSDQALGAGEEITGGAPIRRYFENAVIRVR